MKSFKEFSESLKQARKNIGMDPDKPSCWKGYKAKGTKTKGGKEVPNCVKEEKKKKVKKKVKFWWDDDGDGKGYEKDEVKEGAAWTKKSGKNEKGGLNEKGRKSYERENPGSDLKAPSKKPGNKRRASFCARMKGMRKRQKPSNNTGDDRLSKSLRAWNC